MFDSTIVAFSAKCNKTEPGLGGMFTTLFRIINYSNIKKKYNHSNAKTRSVTIKVRLNALIKVCHQTKLMLLVLQRNMTKIWCLKLAYEIEMHKSTVSNGNNSKQVCIKLGTSGYLDFTTGFSTEESNIFIDFAAFQNWESSFGESFRNPCHILDFSNVFSFKTGPSMYLLCMFFYTLQEFVAKMKNHTF